MGNCCCGNTNESKKPPNCSCESPGGTDDLRIKWQKGAINTSVGGVPIVTAVLSFGDRWGSWKARWGINRMNYKVKPGLYGVGYPDVNSLVFVTANYKMSFDQLRQALKGINAWILVLDTRGINVWCAAGKGSFGTDELVNRIDICQLSQVVNHNELILPQLGAVGVAAHEVQKRTGFKVVYGPVRAKDLPEFIHNGMNATPEMREVRFGFWERLILTPMEVVNVLKPLLILLLGLFLLNLFLYRRDGLSFILSNLLTGFIPFLGAVFTGAVLAPALLPWVPGRAFALKGGILGLIWAATIIWIFNLGVSSFMFYAYLCLLPTISAFLTMNFTGASTYTSLSGVLQEMKFAVPMMKILVGIGSILWFVGIYLQ